MSLGPAQKAELIGAIYEKLGLPAAAEHCGLSIRDVLTASDEDRDFADQIERAMEHLAPLAEQEMIRRAVHGTESYVVSQGRVVFVAGSDGISKPLIEKKYSDTLLTKFLESRNRPVFGPKVDVQHRHEGFLAVPVLTVDQLQKLLQAPDDDVVFLDAEYEVIEPSAPLAVADASAMTADIIPDEPNFDIAYEDEWDIL